MSAPDAPRAVRIWDLPTRVFHWALALSLVGSVVSAKIGGNAMVWHFRLGYLALGLILFRLLWGLFGGHWSRFAQWLYGPAAVWRYARGRALPGDRFEVGHSPLGAMSVVAMLAFVGFQIATGLVADDEISNIGPFNRFVSSALAAQATSYHKNIGQWVLIALVALHVAAVVYYAVVKRQDLIAAMWHGDKALPPDVTATRDSVRTRVLAVLLAALCALAVTWLISLGSP